MLIMIAWHQLVHCLNQLYIGCTHSWQVTCEQFKPVTKVLLCFHFLTSFGFYNLCSSWAWWKHFGGSAFCTCNSNCSGAYHFGKHTHFWSTASFRDVYKLFIIIIWHNCRHNYEPTLGKKATTMQLTVPSINILIQKDCIGSIICTP